MWRGALLILPVFLLVGAGCMIGNQVEEKKSPQVTPEMDTEESQVSADTGLALEIGAPTVSDAVLGLTDALQAETTADVSAQVPIIAPLEISLKSGNFFFDPPLIEAKAGQVVRVTVEENQGLHTFVIDALALRTQLADGAVFTFTAPQKTGDYAFYCDIGEHRTLGMEGILRITE